jgi:hypothetical protein
LIDLWKVEVVPPPLTFTQGDRKMTTPDLDKIASKIQKLLALAEGKGNAAESEAAWAKAQEMATAYQLDLEAMRQRGEAPAADMTKETLKRPDGSWKLTVIVALCKVNGCKPITSGERLFILGSKEDVALVIGLYERIVKQIRHLARMETKAHGQKSKGSWENAYRVGMAMRVGERIKEAFACATPVGSTALVLARDSRVSEYALALYPDLRNRSFSMKVSSDSVALGYAHGERVQFQNALQGK